MTNTDSAEILTLRYLADIESAIRYMENVLEPKFFGEVGRCIEEWAGQRNWAGNFDAEDDDYFWMGAREWRTVDGGEDDYDFWFSLQPIWGAEDEDDATSLAAFIGASARDNRRALVFRYAVPRKKRAWQALLAASSELLLQLRDLGFETDTRAGVISYPVELDRSALGQALADDDFRDALAPLDAALDKVEEALPLFERLIVAARAAE